VIGSFDALRNRTLLRPPDLRAALSRLSLLHILFFLALMGLPSSPNHDGVRLFLPMFPFLAILAGLALGRLEECLRTRLEPRRALIGALAIFSLYLLPPWWQGRHASPYYLSWYNELIGGLPGAANAGMEISYWYDALTPEFIAEVERVLPEGATVLAMPSLRYYRELQELGLMRADLRFGSDLDSSYLLMIARRTTLLSPFLEIYENVQPTLAVELDGVELAGLYALNEDRPTGEPGGGE
jgi:hypothetical protein